MQKHFGFRFLPCSNSRTLFCFVHSVLRRKLLSLKSLLSPVSSGFPGLDDVEDDDLSCCQVAAFLPLCWLSHAAPSASVKPAMKVYGCLF